MKKKILYYTGYAILVLFSLIAILATILPVIPSKEWFIRILDYPRLQTFFIALIAIILYRLFYYKKSTKSYIFIGILVAVVSVQAYKAIPYTPIGSYQVKWTENVKNDSNSISLFICNVLQSNTAYDEVLNKIEMLDPDIIITTESDMIWQESLSVLKNEYPHLIAIPQSNTYGMHVYSRFQLKDSQVRYLLLPDIPSISTQVQLRSGEWIQLFVVHPRPPIPSDETDSKERDAELIMVARDAKNVKGGVIVAGDFNDVAWSETTELFQEVSGLIDPRRGRGFYNTYHAKVPFFRWPLDHIFHSTHFKLIDIERVSSVNSDHFPMYIKLNYEPEVKYQQEEVMEESDTKEEAESTIEKGKEDAK